MELQLTYYFEPNSTVKTRRISMRRLQLKHKFNRLHLPLLRYQCREAIKTPSMTAATDRSGTIKVRKTWNTPFSLIHNDSFRSPRKSQAPSHIPSPQERKTAGSSKMPWGISARKIFPVPESITNDIITPTKTPLMIAAIIGIIPKKTPANIATADAETFLKKIMKTAVNGPTPFNRSAMSLKDSSKPPNRSE